MVEMIPPLLGHGISQSVVTWSHSHGYRSLVSITAKDLLVEYMMEEGGCSNRPGVAQRLAAEYNDLHTYMLPD